MNTLRAAAGDYLALRRALGFKLYDAGLLLEQFIDFLQANHADTITTALAVQWATEPRGVLPAWHARRLAVVRGFARWRHATDPATEVRQTVCYRPTLDAQHRICIPAPTSRR